MKASSSITLINIVDGEDGLSVLSIEEQFSISNSRDIEPTSNWSVSPPQRNEGEILWKREVITYSNSTIKILTPYSITGDKGDIGENGPEGETGKLTVVFDLNTITVKPLQNIGFIKYNGNQVNIFETSKSFNYSGNGIIIVNLNTSEVEFCKLELGTTIFNNNTVQTINIVDYEDATLITTRHSAMYNFSYVKIGEFVINEGGVVETAAITSIEPLDSYFQKAFMKIFRQGNISQNDFENWLDALELKSFYQTLVVSTLLVNSLLANDGQFLNSLKISENNIEGTLNNKLDKPELFKDGITLNSDGSMQANWSGLDENGYPISGWKIEGNGKSYFNGSTMINADVNKITAEQIVHKALKTIDQKNGDTIDYTLAKNEWLSNDFFNQFDSNHINRNNYGIIYNGDSFDYFLKTDNYDQYLLEDNNSYITEISAHDNKILHTWTNTFSYPVFVTAKARLDGTMNAIVWEIINGSYPRELCSISQIEVDFVLFPNETLQCRGTSWALWGSQNASVNYVRFHKTFRGGRENFLELNNREAVEITYSQRNENLLSVPITSITIPPWVEYLYIFVGSDNGAYSSESRGAYVNFKYSINGGTEVDIIPSTGASTDVNYTGYFRIDCSSYNTQITVALTAYLFGDEYEEDGKDKTAAASLNINYIDFGYSVYLSGIPDSFALYDSTRKEKKYFLNNTYYKSDINITMNSINSLSYISKVNKTDFILGLYNYITYDLRDTWLVLTDGIIHTISIDGIDTQLVQLFITSSYIKAIDSNGNTVNLIQEDRYNSLNLYAIVAGSIESIETGHIIPIRDNRVIGTSEKPYQSANINLINATEVHGKVYAS